MNEFDELNIPTYEVELENNKDFKQRSIPYKKYFGEMDLKEEQKEERIDFSKKMEDKLLFLFSLFGVMKEYQRIDREYLVDALRKSYKEVLGAYVEVDKYLEMYVDKFSLETVETTLKNLEVVYALSGDRARYIAENEANTSLNYKDFVVAIMSGKTNKTWNTVEDEKVRKTHRRVDKKTIPILDPFIVGDSLMQFPKDNSLGAEAKEIIGCRCSVKYF